MLELLAVITFFGYIYYLRNYADLRSKSEKEVEEFASGISLYKDGSIDPAFEYFDKIITLRPKSAVAYLYRGLTQKARNLDKEAFNDIQRAASMDDDLYLAHLELGKILLGKEDLQSALTSLNKAISKGHSAHPEPYFWRAQLYLKSDKPQLADQDFETEKQIIDALKNSKSGTLTMKGPFVDKRLTASLVMVLFTSALIIAVIKRADSIHFPLFVAVACAIAIGFVQPRKGWFLALVQGICVFVGYTLFTIKPINSRQLELEYFSLFGAVLMTFVASFIGAFMRRAFVK